LKKASPSAGTLRADFDPVDIALTFEQSGATALSVLTDRRFFQGETGYLDLVRRSVDLPLLRKDFILDEAQVVEARALGADACLLIAAALEPARLEDLMFSCRALDMDSLVEVHNETELAAAVGAEADLIGINNRDLHTFNVSLETTERLAPMVPGGTVIVAESGVETPADIERMKACGVHAVLVGGTLMRAPDLAAATRWLSSI
jgi:indole-3-glycerol phosphate synthase